MPTILRFSAWLMMVYSHDHLPRHVHLRRTVQPIKMAFDRHSLNYDTMEIYGVATFAEIKALFRYLEANIVTLKA
ncbi:hypothetical protein J1781_21425 [Rahnella sp. C60]|uniref:hypothetical protein n=1 Tax=Rahnella perminowiae TaxID=2816244 RepID=UPI001C26FA47|nr:hypothetical protein [Rahnella perminowiae]MBU9808552.1 hypothetical protein [Rahnella perminowiae]MBU9817390.1 hypothetical protein [Rahnella perminowiae]